ncbi:PMEI domain-containing protein [Heracleum sosnowskyi]|uniref:PMEI domain-containing protein n=1 Tax=Heracleum sosnowskyi TaxID=360622 RepID=A0AAD8MC09_9APIA|nr:PMEI domain-containing protein [Heracleum sosnowskyi]
MTKSYFFIPFFLLLAIYSPAGCSAAAANRNFIESSCRATTYPDLCIKSLSLYATTIQNSPCQMAVMALEVSLNRTKSTQVFMHHLIKSKGLLAKQQAAIKDCAEEVEDSLDRVTKSYAEMKSMGRATGEEFTWHMSNVETWISSALTDDTTCMNGFSDLGTSGKIKESVRAQITSVAHYTSNALALINSFAAKHKQ